MHWNLILDSGVKEAQAEEKTAAEEKDAGDKDQRHIPIEEKSDVLKNDGKDETQ